MDETLQFHFAFCQMGNAAHNILVLSSRSMASGHGMEKYYSLRAELSGGYIVRDDRVPQ